MSLLRTCALLLGMLLAPSLVLSQTESVVDNKDLEAHLASALSALKAGRYPDAREQVSGMLDRHLTKMQRVRALYTAARVYYPPNPRFREPDSAKALLAQLVQAAACVRLPDDNPWQSELENLYRAISDRIVAFDVVVPDDTVLRGSRALNVQVCSNRPLDVQVSLEDVSHGNGVAILDHVRGAHKPLLRVPFVANDTLLVRNGEYVLRVRANELVNDSTVRGLPRFGHEVEYRVQIQTAALPYDTLAAQVRSRLRAECRNPQRIGVVAKAFVGGAISGIVPFLTAFRGYANRPYQGSAAYAGVVVFGAGVLAARMDTAIAIRESIAWNDVLLRDYRRRRQAEIDAHEIRVRVMEVVRENSHAAVIAANSPLYHDAGVRLQGGKRQVFISDTLRPTRCRAAESVDEYYARSWTNALVPELRLTGNTATIEHQGWVTEPGTSLGSTFEALLNWKLAALSIHTRYGGTNENWAIDASIGPAPLRLVVGSGMWGSIVTYGSDSNALTSPAWNYGRLGVQSQLAFGGSGFSLDTRLIRYRRMKPDIQVPDFEPESQRMIWPRGHGGEVDVGLSYSVPKWPIFFRIGHRVEVLEAVVNDEYEPATESVNSWQLGGGLRTSLRTLLGR